MRGGWRDVAELKKERSFCVPVVYFVHAWRRFFFAGGVFRDTASVFRQRLQCVYRCNTASIGS